MNSALLKGSARVKQVENWIKIGNAWYKDKGSMSLMVAPNTNLWAYAIIDNENVIESGNLASLSEAVQVCEQYI